MSKKDRQCDVFVYQADKGSIVLVCICPVDTSLSTSGMRGSFEKMPPSYWPVCESMGYCMDE